MALPWDKDKINLSEFYSDHKYLKGLEIIQEFLCNKARVDHQLLWLFEERDYDYMGTWDVFLTKLEKKFGFCCNTASQTTATRGFLPPDEFLDYIQAGVPLMDHGAGKKHGAYTHRVQWLLICNEIWQHHPSHLGIDLYKSCAKVTALHLKNTDTHYRPLAENSTIRQKSLHQWKHFSFLWDDLVESRGQSNASSPSFLMQYKDEWNGGGKFEGWT